MAISDLSTLLNTSGMYGQVMLGVKISLAISIILIIFFFIYFRKMYTIEVEYWRMTGNNTFEILSRKARKIVDKGGNIVYKLYRSNLKLKRPDGFDLVYRKNGKDHIKVLREGETEYSFITFDHTKKAFTTIPADIAEFVVLELEKYFEMHKTRAGTIAKWMPLVMIILFIMGLIITTEIIMGTIVEVSHDVTAAKEEISKIQEKQMGMFGKLADKVGLGGTDQQTTAPG